MLHNCRNLAGILALFLCAQVLGQVPTTGPTTTAAPRPRDVVVIPPGFRTVEINRRTVILETADEPWVRQSLETISSTSMPSTMPSDLVGQLTVSKERIKKEISDLLALTDPKPVNEFFDDKLPGVLKLYDNINPPLFYFVTSDPKLKDLLRGGWTNSRFYYSRSSNTWAPNGRLDMTADRRADDVVIPIIYNPEDNTTARKDLLSRGVKKTESDLARSISFEGMRECRVGLLTFVLAQMNEPVRDKLDREWAVVGLAGVIGSRYTALITGEPYEALIREISADGPQMLSQTAVDLINPPAEKDMRASYRPAYLGAHRRKSVRVMNSWHARAGDAAITKLLVELRKNPPADGKALLAQIKQVSGIDLAQDVGFGH